MTKAEIKLWVRLQQKQVSGIQFYRQKPIGGFIVDFYAPKVKLIIEVDGSQHFTEEGREKDEERDFQLKELGLQILRFSNLQVLKEMEAVMEEISRIVKERINS